MYHLICIYELKQNNFFKILTDQIILIKITLPKNDQIFGWET